jgi:hypothetical protein
MHTTLDERYYVSQGMVPDGTYLKLDSDTLMPVRHTFGYYVAHPEFGKPVSAYKPTNSEQMHNIVKSFNDDGYIGVWSDQHTGSVWVEQSFWVEHWLPAKALGQAWHQLAVWDCAREEAIAI